MAGFEAVKEKMEVIGADGVHVGQEDLPAAEVRKLLGPGKLIGVLFGTNQRGGEATQSVLFIVPTIVEPVARQQRDYIREALEAFDRFSGYIHAYELIERNPPGYGAPGGQGSAAPPAPEVEE